MAHPLNGLTQKRIAVKTARLPGQAFAYSPSTVPLHWVPGSTLRLQGQADKGPRGVSDSAPELWV